jgi:hypothetical protein
VHSVAAHRTPDKIKDKINYFIILSYQNILLAIQRPFIFLGGFLGGGRVLPDAFKRRWCACFVLPVTCILFLGKTAASARNGL